MSLSETYPNLCVLVQGCVSGRISEWPKLKSEARAALAEIETLRGARRELCVEEQELLTLYRIIRGARKP